VPPQGFSVFSVVSCSEIPFRVDLSSKNVALNRRGGNDSFSAATNQSGRIFRLPLDTTTSRRLGCAHQHDKGPRLKSTSDDEQRFLALVNENRNRILRVCRVYAWNAADQDDLYQEMLFQIWRSLPGLKEKQFANTWLYRVAINTALSFARKRAAGSGRVIHFEQADLARTVESRQTAEENTDDRIADLYTAIYKLDPLEKALVTLFLEDLTYEEVAEATGMSANHVGVMLHRAKKKLSVLMGKERPR
jgi:RNA polymerase sigma-70 factor (ECF subfamily)